MATVTPNLGLRKPEGPDFVNVTTDIADNMQLIDNTFATSVPPAISITGTGTAGSATRVARADHNHAGPGFGTPVSVGTVNSSGSSSLVARADHVHAGGLGTDFVALDTWWPLDPSGSDYAYFYLPSAASLAKLSLFGNAGRSSGPLPQHNHGVSTLSSNSGTTEIDHNHTFSSTTQTQSGDHTHSITVDSGGGHGHSGNSGAGGSHTHTGGSNAHNHSFSRDGGASSPPWRAKLEAIAGTSTSSFLGDTTVTVNIDSVSDHSHSLSIDAASGHTHTGSSGGVSANHSHNYSGTVSMDITLHYHDITHTHTTTNTGAQGYTTGYKWPQTVSILIDGVDRTVALGGPFGPSQADWSQFDLNVQPYLTAPGWHYISYSNTTGGGKLRAYLYVEL